MGKTRLKYIAELGHIGAAPTIKLESGKLQNGRLKNLLQHLQDTVAREMRKASPTTLECLDARAKIKEFQDAVGWGEDERHTCTYINFCRAFMGESETEFSPQIWELIDEIEDYFARAGKVPAPSLWSADEACRKWQAIWGIHEEEGQDSQDRLKAADEIVARENAMAKYRERFYPETREAV